MRISGDSQASTQEKIPHIWIPAIKLEDNIFIDDVFIFERSEVSMFDRNYSDKDEITNFSTRFINSELKTENYSPYKSSKKLIKRDLSR